MVFYFLLALDSIFIVKIIIYVYYKTLGIHLVVIFYISVPCGLHFVYIWLL